MYGPCRSSIGGGQALPSPRRHSLGRPLPYQLADTPQSLPQAINLYPAVILVNRKFYRTKLRLGPSSITSAFAELSLTWGEIPTYYYLVCRGSKPTRLACLIHAASVHSELGSNSQQRFMPPIEGHESIDGAEENKALPTLRSGSRLFTSGLVTDKDSWIKNLYLCSH